MMKRAISKCARLTVAALLCGGAIPVFAQVAANPDEQAVSPQSETNSGLADIIVTAERRQQSLQDVPIAATVLSGADLASKGVTTLNNIQQVAPSIAINTYNRSTYINIRGVGIAQSAPTSSPGVAFYIDGQLIPHEFFIAHSFFDIGTIEVLRGPQGTLTGQNSTGGAVFVRSPAPDYDNVSGFADLTVGNYDAYRFVGALNVPLSENAAVRVAYLHDQRDSFTKNIGPSGDQPGNANTDSVRAILAMRSNDEKLHLTVRGEYFNSDSDNNAVKNRFDAVTKDPFTIEEDSNSYLRQHGYRLSGEARWAFTDGVELRSSVSYQNGTTIDAVDGDRTATALPVPAGLPVNAANRALYPGRTGINGTDIDTVIGEINLLSTGKGPFTWVAGAFYVKDDVDANLLLDNRNTTALVQSNSTINLATRNLSKSLFGQANWFVTDQVELIAGVRHSWDSQRTRINQLQGPVLNPAPVNKVNSAEWTGKVGVNVHLNNGLLMYVTASKGYKSGGNNPIPGSTPYGPETNFVYEGGVKSTLFDRHLRINGAVFYSDYKDIQLQSTLALPLTQNASSGKGYGGELEATAQFGSFSANFGIAYLHATFAQNACITNAGLGVKAPTDPCAGNNQLVPKGRVLPFSPEWTMNGGAQYALDLGNDRVLTPRLQWSHLASQEATPFPGADSFVPGRDIFDARLTFAFNESYSIEAFVNNFTDKTYIASQIQNATSASGGILYGAPRTYGVRALVKFGS